MSWEALCRFLQYMAPYMATDDVLGKVLDLSQNKYVII